MCQSSSHWTDYVKFDTGDFHENLSRNSNLVKIRQKYWALYKKSKVHSCFWEQYKISFSSKTVQSKTIFVCLCQHSMVLYCWQLHTSQQQQNGNTLLCVHSYNGYVNVPQCYVTCTLPILYVLISRCDHTATTISSQNFPTPSPPSKARQKGEKCQCPLLWQQKSCI